MSITEGESFEVKADRDAVQTKVYCNDTVGKCVEIVNICEDYDAFICPLFDGEVSTIEDIIQDNGFGELHLEDFENYEFIPKEYRTQYSYDPFDTEFNEENINEEFLKSKGYILTDTTVQLHGYVEFIKL